MNIDTIQATCDGHARGVAATDWGMTALPCNTTVGLTTWTDTEGQSHRACHPHLAAMRRRFPERYVSEIADDPLGQVKALREIVIEDHETYVVVADVAE